MFIMRLTQNYGVNVQGGDDVANYNLSIGYANAQSTLKYNDFSRLNMRFNTDVKFMKNLDCSLDVAYSNTTRNLRDDGMGNDRCCSGNVGALLNHLYWLHTILTNMADLRHPWQTTIVLTCPIPCPYWKMATQVIKPVGVYFVFIECHAEMENQSKLTLSEKVSYVLNNVTERSFIPDEGVPTLQRVVTI